MKHRYFSLAIGRRYLLSALGLLATLTAQAQAPAWNGAAAHTTQASGYGSIAAVATDASGNVFVTGVFGGTVAFGATVLTNAGGQDLFVAKYVPATNTWAWAQSGGGTGADYGQGIAVRGNSVYVTGQIVNNTANASAVVFGGTSPATGTSVVRGASATTSADLLLAKYTDQGSSATLAWAQVGGGTGNDYGQQVAVSGSSLYVTGNFTNTSGNANAVVLGGNGTTAGTSPVSGASSTASFDWLLAKYTDNGATGTYQWSQVGGGTDNEYAYGVAVSGSAVYVTGNVFNSTTNSRSVLFGGSGTTAGTVRVNGATATASRDLLLAKYLDAGPSATLAWTQVGGGTDSDGGYGLAVSGSSLYVAGSIGNTLSNSSGVVFGGNGSTAGTTPVPGASTTLSTDLLLAKYTDNGPSATLGWTQVGGGTRGDAAQGVAVSGSSVYVTGGITSDNANSTNVLFGGGGTTAGSSPVPGASTTSGADLLLAKYLDNGATGSYQWSQVGGGTGTDGGYSVAASGQQVYVAGFTTPPATFGPTVLPAPASASFTITLGLVASLTDAALTPLAVRAGSTAGAGKLALYPNPSAGAASLQGAAPGTVVQVLDALGRVAATATTDATGTAALGELTPGLYLVRAGGSTVRLAVQ